MSEVLEFAKVLRRKVDRLNAGTWAVQFGSSLDAAIAEFEFSRAWYGPVPMESRGREQFCLHDGSAKCICQRDADVRTTAGKTGFLDGGTSAGSRPSPSPSLTVADVEPSMLRSENIWLKQRLQEARAEVNRLRAMIVPGDAAAHEEHMAELRRLRAIEAKAREWASATDNQLCHSCIREAVDDILAAGDEA